MLVGGVLCWCWCRWKFGVWFLVLVLVFVLVWCWWVVLVVGVGVGVGVEILENTNWGRDWNFGEYKLRKRLNFWRIQTEKEIENEELIWKPGPREIWRIQTKIESICRIKTEKEIENRKNWYGNLRYREFAILQLYFVRNLTQTHKSRLEFQTGLRLENIFFVQ